MRRYALATCVYCDWCRDIDMIPPPCIYLTLCVVVAVTTTAVASTNPVAPSPNVTASITSIAITPTIAAGTCVWFLGEGRGQVACGTCGGCCAYSFPKRSTLCCDDMCTQPLCYDDMCAQPLCCDDMCAQPLCYDDMCAQPLCCDDMCTQPLCYDDMCAQPCPTIRPP